jgi:DNA helicase-2/ATP-dependent DNA helicase PcrA
VPYRVVGAASFYDRREVKDVIAYLRLLVNSADDGAFLRAVMVPKRGIGLASVRVLQEAASRWSKPLLETASIADRISELRPHAKRRLQDFAELCERLRRQAERASPASVLETVLEAVDYEAYLAREGPEGMDRIENVRELLAAAADWSETVQEDEAGTPLEQFLATAALTTAADNTGGDPEGVTLMTLHTAKGLEWPVVVVAGLEDGLFPLRRALDSPAEAEEERRLMYVGVTRAMDRIYLTWARSRRRGGQLMPGVPSRFLEGLPAELVDERRTSGLWDGDALRRRSRSQMWAVLEDTEPEMASQDAPRYVKGERVRHRRFGSGTIAAITGAGRELKATVMFDDGDVGAKQLLVAYAGLERDWEGA